MWTDVYRSLPIEHTTWPPLSYHKISLILVQNISPLISSCWPKILTRKTKEKKKFWKLISWWQVAAIPRLLTNQFLSYLSPKITSIAPYFCHSNCRHQIFNLSFSFSFIYLISFVLNFSKKIVLLLLINSLEKRRKIINQTQKFFFRVFFYLLFLVSLILFDFT